MYGFVFLSRSVLRKLQELYGHPKNIDLWVGGLLEEDNHKARVGPTVQCLLVNQFKRLRDGDRFWYQNPSTFTSDQQAQIRATSLAKIICDNSDQINHVYPNVFKIQGQELEDCSSIPGFSLFSWIECQDEEPHVTRFKREYNEHYYEEDPSGERIEGLESILLQNKIEFLKMQRQMVRMNRALIKMTANSREESVCVASDG